jgi:ABC-type xylose transport system permease subunit
MNLRELYIWPILPILSHAFCAVEGAILALKWVGWLAWPWWVALLPAVVVPAVLGAFWVWAWVTGDWWGR